MEMVLKDSNFIEEKKQHPKSRYTSDIRRLRVGARPAHFIVSEARHIERGDINQYRFTPPLLKEHIHHTLLPREVTVKTRLLRWEKPPACSVGKSDQREHADF